MAADRLSVDDRSDSDQTHLVRMIGLQESLPEETVTVVRPNLQVETVSLTKLATGWLMVLFYPRDFSFVCPTELTAFSDRLAEFDQRECSIVGVSVDAAETHRDWLQVSRDEGGIVGLEFPLLADPELTLTRRFGVLDSQTELAQRGLFLFSPDQRLKYAVVHANSVGRNVNEALRVLDALRSGGLCPASWTAADGTLDLDKLLNKGRVLERFRLEEQLGKGTFGSVFSAWDLRLTRRVALKILRRREQTSWQTLLEEARSASRIQHPNVCTVHSLEEIDGLSMIVMQHVEGEPLSKMLKGGLPIHEALEFAKRIASGVAAAHAMGVIHGDLKPANVLIDPTHNPVIVDFGLATVRETRRKNLREALVSESNRSPDAKLHDVEEAGQTMDVSSRPGIHGTPAYMSPEQSRGEPLCGTSDIFSLGLLVFEMVTGERAIAGANIVEILTKLQEPDIGGSIAKRAPPSFQALLLQMLASEPQQRIRIEQVCDALTQLQSSLLAADS